MKKLVSCLLALLLSVCMFADMTCADNALIESGYAVDENGFCITTGEFFESLYALLTDKSSEFYTGVEVHVANGQTTPEIRSVVFSDFDISYMVTTSSAGKDNFPKDDEPFDMIMIIGDLSTDVGRLGMMTVSGAVIHMTNKDANGWKAASDLSLELIDKAEKWVQKGKLEYMYSNITGTTYALAVREIAAYK